MMRIAGMTVLSALIAMMVIAVHGVSRAPTTWLNIVTEGADPTGRADATTVIQSVVDRLAPGGVMYVPPGTYSVCQIILNNPIGVVGAGRYSSTFRARNACNKTLFVDRTTAGLIVPGFAVGPYEFHGIGVNGNAAGQTRASHCFWLFGPDQWVDVLIINCAGDAVRDGNDGTLRLVSNPARWNTQWRITESQILLPRGNGVSAFGPAGDFVISRNRIQGIGSSANCIRANAGGSIISGNELNGGSPCILQEAPFGAGETVSNNMINGVFGHAIYFAGSPGPGGYDGSVQIANNIAYNDGGLLRDNAFSCIVIVNTNRRSPTAEITVQGNVCSESPGVVRHWAHGIVLENDGGGMRDIYVIENTWAKTIRGASLQTAGLPIQNLVRLNNP